MRLRGFIKGINQAKAYCFLHLDDGREFFLHANDLAGGRTNMTQGRMIEFTPIETGVEGKKPRACKAEALA